MIEDILKEGGLCVIPTDTLYGLVASAKSKEAVLKIYDVKGRDKNKPLLILISSPNDLASFGVSLSSAQKEACKKYWPGKVTIIFPSDNSEFEYLSAGTGELAFRIPADEALRDLLSRTGPLVAPSANPQGKPPAQTAEEARSYFGANVTCYSDGGALTGSPSTIIRVKEDGAIETVREGATPIS